MVVAECRTQARVFAPDARGPVGRNLVTNGEMQAHMQKRVGLTIFRREVAGKRIGADLLVVLRVPFDYTGDLAFQRCQRQALAGIFARLPDTCACSSMRSLPKIMPPRPAVSVSCGGIRTARRMLQR